MTNPFETEVEASEFVRGFFRSRSWNFREQVSAGGGRIDFVLTDGDEAPVLGVEVKKDIDNNTSASRLADVLEQAVGYSRDLDVPVVVGPAMLDLGRGRMGFDRLHLGGRRLDSIAALTIFGGRVNVGVMAFDKYQRDARMCIALRGQIVYRYCTRDDIEDWCRDVRMVRSTNSQKVRG